MKLKCPPTDLRGYWPEERKEVMYAVSYSYNGGITVDNEWYHGFDVPPPLIRPGYGIVGIGVGLQLNARPPLATGVLVPIEKINPDTPYLDSTGVWKRKGDKHGKRKTRKD